MNSYDLALPGALIVRVEHFRPVFANEQARLLLSAYLSGVAFLEAPAVKVDLTISCRESIAKGLRRSNTHIILNDGYHGDGSLLDLIHLLYGATRLLWLKRGFYPVHSACIGNDDGYVLVVGHSGSGKTSIALELAKSEQRVFSANKTLVSLGDGNLLAVAGTRTITTTAEDASRHSIGGVRVGYVGRSAFLLDDQMYAAASTVPVRKIAIVRLNDGAKECSSLSPDSAMHRLYPFFLDVMNADVILCGGEEVFTGTPPRNSRQSLVEGLRSCLAKVPVCAVTGSMEFVTVTLRE